MNMSIPPLVAAIEPAAITALTVGILFAILIGGSVLFSMFYRKAQRGQALIKTGFRGTKVSFNGFTVVPVLERLETMDISLKRVEIDRTAKNGLICKDNMRADIKVAFFVRVNQTDEDVLRVAQSVGCDRCV